MSKEIGGKKHVFRKLFTILSTVCCVGALGFLISSSFVVNPAFTVIQYASVALMGGSALGILVGMQKLKQSIVIGHNKSKSNKLLKQIQDTSKVRSKEKNLKLIKNYAKTNLKLCKLLGTPYNGKFVSLSGLSARNNQNFNEIDNLALYKEALQIQTKDSNNIVGNTINNLKFKLSDKKINKKTKIIKDKSLKTPRKYTKEIEFNIDNINQISIYDRRTEIGCLTEKTEKEFQNYVKDLKSTNEIGSIVKINFHKKDINTKLTYARVPEKSYNNTLKMMLEDVKTQYISSTTQDERESLFPITVQCYNVKSNTKVTNNLTLKISDYNELVQNINNLTQDRTK